MTAASPVQRDDHAAMCRRQQSRGDTKEHIAAVKTLLRDVLRMRAERLLAHLARLVPLLIL